MRQLSSFCIIAGLAIAATLASSETQAQSAGTTLFKDVRVFDGTRTLEAQQVLIGTAASRRLPAASTCLKALPSSTVAARPCSRV